MICDSSSGPWPCGLYQEYIQLHIPSRLNVMTVSLSLSMPSPRQEERALAMAAKYLFSLDLISAIWAKGGYGPRSAALSRHRCGPIDAHMAENNEPEPSVGSAICCASCSTFSSTKSIKVDRIKYRSPLAAEVVVHAAFADPAPTRQRLPCWSRHSLSLKSFPAVVAIAGPSYPILTIRYTGFPLTAFHFHAPPVRLTRPAGLIVLVWPFMSSENLRSLNIPSCRVFVTCPSIPRQPCRDSREKQREARQRQ